MRFQQAQVNRQLDHPKIQKGHEADFQFVVCADTQFGMISNNKDWQAEQEYSQRAIECIHKMNPKPLFCCICGDMVNMSSNLYKDMPVEECDRIQDAQNQAMKDTWKHLDPDIALICVCGNHDVGNRPNEALIQRFKDEFGDDYLAFWVHSTYNIVLNTNLFSDPTDAIDAYQEQLRWLEERLQHANDNNASHIFVYGHHPWFLYHQDETSDQMTGRIPFPGGSLSDSYFHIPLERRKVALDLFKKYKVDACFNGHYHQNLCAETEWGMKMITTSALSFLLRSDQNNSQEPHSQGIRAVQVHKDGGFSHNFVNT